MRLAVDVFDLLLTNWDLVLLAIVIGTALYVVGVVFYYAFLYDDPFMLDGEQDALTRALLIPANEIRNRLSLAPVWSIPQDVPEKEMVRTAARWLAHMQGELSRHRRLQSRAASNRAALQALSRKTIADMVQALWAIQWSRELGETLSRTDAPDSERLARVRQVEQRNLQRMQRSFDSLVAFSTRMLELGSEVSDSDVERLLAGFRETVTRLEEDAQALEEVRKNSL